MVGPLLSPKPRQIIPAHVSCLTSYIKTEGLASPWNHHQTLITFAQHSSLHRPFRMGGTVYRLSACCLLFICLIIYYEFTFYTFYCSNMLLSIAFFAWGRVIIYDDNLLRFHILHFLLLKHASLHRLFRMGESDYL